jgi:hypothetical protein
VNGFFLLMTVAVAYLPDGSSAGRRGMFPYLAQFTLGEERNLATSWEGWCLLLVAVLAFERFLQGRKTETYKNQSWLGLSMLALGLSLDELGSIHEQTQLLFKPWGLSGTIKSNIPLALPALLLLIITLRWMWYFANRRHFWLTLSAFILFGSVAFQEHLEHTVPWPWWAAGIRVGIEEGTELFGVFLLLSVFVPARDQPGAVSITSLAPRATTLIQLKLMLAFLTLASFIPLAFLSIFVISDAHYRGVPAAWLPFVLLNLSSMAAWACAQKAEIYRGGFFVVFLLALFFSLDQIIVFERIIDKNLVLGNLSSLMFPCLAAACLAIPTVRTRCNFILFGALLPLSVGFFFSSNLLPWLVLPVQSLGIFWVLSSELAETAEVAPLPFQKRFTRALL